MLTVNSSKTFDEILVEQPHLYDDIAGYTWDNDTNQWVNTGVSEVTKAQIEDWFGLRKVCDDEKFARFFARKMNLTAMRYAQQLRLELTTFDPLVAEYMEREILNNHSKSIAGSSEEVTSGSATHKTSNSEVRTPDLTEVIDRDTSASRSSEEGGQDEVNKSGSSSGESVNVQKNAPMSIEYAGATAGQIPNLNWGSMTAQAQAKNSGEDSSDETTTYGKTEQGSESGTEDQTKHETGTETRVLTGSVEDGSAGSKTGSSSSAESGSGQEREIYTGRHGMTPQAALKSAISYIKTVSSFDWLREELEECFLSIYDI